MHVHTVTAAGITTAIAFASVRFACTTITTSHRSIQIKKSIKIKEKILITGFGTGVVLLLSRIYPVSAGTIQRHERS